MKTTDKETSKTYPRHTGLKITALVVAILLAAAIVFGGVYIYYKDTLSDESDAGEIECIENFVIRYYDADENGVSRIEWTHMDPDWDSCDNFYTAHYNFHNTNICMGHTAYKDKYGEILSYYPTRKPVSLEPLYAQTGDINSKIQAFFVFDNVPAKEDTYFNVYPVRIEVVSECATDIDKITLTENYYYSAGYYPQSDPLDVSYLNNYFAASYGVKGGVDYYDYIANDLGYEYGYNLSGGSYTYGFRSDYVSDEGKVYTKSDPEYSNYAYVGYTQSEVESGRKINLDKIENSSRICYEINDELRDGCYTLSLSIDGNKYESSFYLDTDSLWDEATDSAKRWYSWEDAPMGKIVRYTNEEGIEVVQNCDSDYIWYHGDPSRVSIYRDTGCGFESMQICADIKYYKYDFNAGYYNEINSRDILDRITGIIDEDGWPYEGVYFADGDETMCVSGNMFPTANPGYASNAKYLVDNFVSGGAVDYTYIEWNERWEVTTELIGYFEAGVKENIILTDFAGNEHTCAVSVLYLEYWRRNINDYAQKLTIAARLDT